MEIVNYLNTRLKFCCLMIDNFFLGILGARNYSYQTYGDEPYIRSAEEITFHVALFIAAKNGTYINYYMVLI